MELYDDGYEKSRRRITFFMSAGATLVAGLVLAGLALYLLQPPPKVVEKPQVRIIREPAPPPQVVVREVVKEVIKNVPVPAVLKTPERKPWEGIWKHETGQLPMFQLKASGRSVTGRYAPNRGAVLGIAGGKDMGNGVELLVDDGLFRVKFRLTVAGDNLMNAQAWISDESWLDSLARGNSNRQVRTPEQAEMVIRILHENIKLTKQPQTIGLFVRGTED